MDTDNSGTIEFKEFIIAVSVGTKGTAEQKLKWAFSIYDIDRNGSIEYDEMLHLFKSIFKMMPFDENETPQQRCRKIFDKMDINGDQKLTLEEFIEGCKQDQQIIKAMSLF
jgi:Ca2+-binding EF-hand superfamily protein